MIDALISDYLKDTYSFEFEFANVIDLALQEKSRLDLIYEL